MKIVHAPYTWSRSARARRSVVAPPVPRPFDFGFTARRPLVPLPAVSMFLNQDALAVLALIEEGKLQWAFDLRSARAALREVRVLRQRLFEYTGLYHRDQSQHGAEAEKFSAIMDLILPAGEVLKDGELPSLRPGWPRPATRDVAPAPAFSRLERYRLLPTEPVLCGTEIARCFSCSATHIRKLIRDGLIPAVTLCRAPKASPLVTRDNVIAFLKQRRMS